MLDFKKSCLTPRLHHKASVSSQNQHVCLISSHEQSEKLEHTLIHVNLAVCGICFAVRDKHFV